MLNRIFAVVVTIGLLLTGVASNAAPKPKDYKPTSTSWDRCEHDDFIPSAWKKLAEAHPMYECESPFRIVSKSLPKAGPKTSVSSTSDFQNVDSCRIVDAGDDQQTTFKGFPGNQARQQVFDSRRFPSAKTVFQIVPLESSDAPAGNHTPMGDYGKFFAWLKNYLTYISDFGGNIEFRVPAKYIRFSKSLESYHLRHENGNIDIFTKDAIPEVDEKIDFTGANVVLFIAPAGTLPSIFSQQRLDTITTNEGTIYNVGSAYPNTSIKGSFEHSIAPIWWLHELYHGGLNLDDQPGDQKWQDGPDRGMGKWGLMSTGETEFLTWHKWLLGFTNDKQVACVDPAKVSTTWVAPSSYRTKKTKLLVVPLGKNKAIVVESIRAAGLNFKLGSQEQGALTYVVDTKVRGHDGGFTVLRTEAKAKAAGTSMNFQKTSPLYKGESVTYEGVKITNVEWGDFGDVIRVEPVK